MGNYAGPDAICVPAREDLAAFDTLPPAIRALIRENPVNWSAAGIHALLDRRGGDIDDAAEAIVSATAKKLLAERTDLWGFGQLSPDDESDVLWPVFSAAERAGLSAACGESMRFAW